jgi:copper resistance protein B
MTIGRRKSKLVIAGVICLVHMLVSAPEIFSQEGSPKPGKDQEVFWFLLFDQLEYRGNEGPDTLNWDVQGWIGGDYNRIWVKTEGEHQTSGDSAGEAEVQVLYSRLISPFWDFQAGVRYERLYGTGPDPSRGFAVAGIQGLAPYWFELDFALFLSDDGDVSARLTAEYDLLLTQRLILQPRLEVDVAAQDVPEFGLGKGFNDIELGLRLRYEIRREFAPYIGISWTRQLGDTADITRSEGGDVDNFAVLAGLRLWF